MGKIPFISKSTPAALSIGTLPAGGMLEGNQTIIKSTSPVHRSIWKFNGFEPVKPEKTGIIS